ncbi:MAG: hypothetical protein WCQ16_05080 [Verrucomicrobiae bacterium]
MKKIRVPPKFFLASRRAGRYSQKTMKRSIASLIAVFVVASAHAGSFGGPTSLNTSNVTGAVGRYQATARGNSLTGIIRFSYDANGNPSATTARDYIFFIDGMIVTGSVDAAIMGSKLAGILENGTVAAVSPLLAGYRVDGGSFTAKFDTGSANYFFKGKGNLQTFSQVIAPVWVSVWRDFKVAGQKTSTTP